jgi:hypothetical protein
MYRRLIVEVCCFLLAAAVAGSAQSQQQPPQDATAQQVPEANPGRPTVATPATLTPVGYLQFETGILAAWQSPGVVSQTSINEVIKYSPSRWVELLVSSQPYAHSHAVGQPDNASGDVDLGVQGILYHGENVKPTVAVSYFGRVYSGAAPNLDIGSPTNSALLLASGDVKGFHYDANCIFNEVVNQSVRRAEFGQTLSISHTLGEKFGITGEIWHFTQPFLHDNAVANLWAVSYAARKNLVLDCGFDHGLTSTSTQWEVFAGFTYLLPHKLPLTWPRTKGSKDYVPGGFF